MSCQRPASPYAAVQGTAWEASQGTPLDPTRCGRWPCLWESSFMPVDPLPRDYSREPTLLTAQAVHALVRELLDYANVHQTWGVEVAEAFVDLIATRLSDTYAPLDPTLAREVLGGIRAHWASEPLAYVDALCTVLANLGDTRPFLREQLATERSPAAHAVLAETLAELDRSFADEASTG
jgi:hypothetical protein